MIRNLNISQAMTIKLEDALKELPQPPKFVEGIRRAPKRSFTLTQKETERRRDLETIAGLRPG